MNGGSLERRRGKQSQQESAGSSSRLILARAGPAKGTWVKKKVVGRSGHLAGRWVTPGMKYKRTGADERELSATSYRGTAGSRRGGQENSGLVLAKNGPKAGKLVAPGRRIISAR